MDDVTPLYPASRFADAYCDMQDGERNLFYLFGLSGLLALVERENAAVPGRHALDVHAITQVVRAWADCESDTWTGGFVLELRDKSRVYVEGYESDGWPQLIHTNPARGTIWPLPGSTLQELSRSGLPL